MWGLVLFVCLCIMICEADVEVHNAEGFYIQKWACKQADPTEFVAGCDDGGIVVTKGPNVRLTDGEWSENWFDEDSEHKNGDMETIFHIKRFKNDQCGKVPDCWDFEAVRIDLSDVYKAKHKHATVGSVGNMLHVDWNTTKSNEHVGFYCLNSENKDKEDKKNNMPGCADYKVKYYCSAAKRDCVTPVVEALMKVEEKIKNILDCNKNDDNSKSPDVALESENKVEGEKRELKINKKLSLLSLLSKYVKSHRK